jgi:hypothetical protein
VHHSSADHVAADYEFSSARALMDPAALCAWDDIGELLSREDGRIYAALPCHEKLSVTRNAWWLAQPLFSRAGNDRRSEHDVRRVYSRLSETGVNPTWLRWGRDMEEIVVRLGWPAYWRRYWGTMGSESSTNPHVTQYNLEPSYHFIPTLAAIRNPYAAAEHDWHLLPSHSYEEYSPHEMVFDSLAHQSARLLRGDSTILLTRLDVTQHYLTGDSVQAIIAFSRAPSEEPALCSALITSTSSSRTARECGLPDAESVASIEIVDRGNTPRTQRARFGVAPIRVNSSGHALSDIVFLEGNLATPVSYAAARQAMRHNLRIQASARTTLYWEVYGVRAGDRITYEIAAANREERGFIRKIGEALRLVAPGGPLQVSWEEITRADAGIHPTAVALDLSRLRPGVHAILLRVSINSTTTLVVERRVEILR